MKDEHVADLGPISSAVAAAKRTAERAGASGQLALPFERAATSTAPKDPTIVILGKARTAPATTRSLIEEFARRGLEPGKDVIFSRFKDVRVAKEGAGGTRAFARLAEGTGGDGQVIAGRGANALILPRGGGNLSAVELRKLSALEHTDGVHLLADESFIRRVGSKAVTKDVLEQVPGMPMPLTISVQGGDQAATATAKMLERSPDGVAVLKKVNSLGGKDVHFVKTPDEARVIADADAKSEYVAQEYLPNARNQDMRGHAVYNSETGRFEPQNWYVRNRVVGSDTPNLANGGYATLYVPSPWELTVAEQAANALAKGSAQPPAHFAIDLFPRNVITPSTSERHAAIWGQIERGELTRAQADEMTSGSAVIGEAASSAGTKGTEATLQGANPVVSAIVDEALRRRNAIIASGR